ncbi:hypothetical protein FEK30_01150 (plasmid) [Picosynechococcus sp. PCC 11901]|uniref:hypothetical protein n=1 Tax=Picosynechococcus sp. PCC 11901 TaxID=2579791 RepID=UPI0010FC2265|nr:hypothetical protein [Picosynechococcus sp. PCC 11901]QCS48151.1 hypothetical protein FEK30_01150 [Picosynechococcus sp. PCC 11901]
MGRPSKLKNASQDIQNRVIELNRKGYSQNYIAQTLTESGFKIDARSIARFLDSLGHDRNHSKKWDKSNHVDYGETKTAQDTQQDVIIVDIDKIKSEYGLSDDLTKPENVIGNVQKLASEILLLEQMICIEKLKAYAKAKTKHPSEALRGCKIAYEIFASVWGVEQTININSAMATIERHYGSLESLKQIEEIEES